MQRLMRETADFIEAAAACVLERWSRIPHDITQQKSHLIEEWKHFNQVIN